MKKSLKILITLLSVSLLAVLFVACTKNITPEVPEKHTLSFVDDGKTVSTIQTAGNEKITLPEAEKINGFTFVGWFFDKDEWKIQLTENYYENKPLTQDTTVYAYRTKDSVPSKQYKVNFVTNGGTPVADIVTECIETSPQTTRTHYHFDGWYSTKDFQENSEIEFPYYPKSDTTLYAKWTQTEFYITFEENGGSTVADGWYCEIKTSPATTLDHYLFDGWYSTEDFQQNSKIEFPYYPQSDTTLYAKWTQTEFYITFEENGGSSVSDGWYSEIKTSPATTLDHYHFDGWYSTKDFQENSEIEFPYYPQSDTTLYAKWTQTEFYITFEENGGSTVADDWYSQLDSEPFTEQAGFDFTGWYKDENLSSENLIEYPFVPEDDMTLYAGWKKAVDPKLLSIDGFNIEGTTATKTSPLGGDTAEFDFEQQNVTVSETAQWAIYKDADCTQVYQDNIVPIELGENIFYLKVSADGKSCVYTVKINKVDGYALDIYENRTYKGTVFANKGDMWEKPIPEYDETLYDFDGEYYADENMTIPFTDFQATDNKTVYVKIYYIGLKFSSFINTVSDVIPTDDPVVYLKIPSEINGSPVLHIQGGFQNNFTFKVKLEEVLIEKGVKSINNSAFYYCDNLKKVTLPDGIVLAGGVFNYCPLLSQVICDGIIRSSATNFANTAYYNDESNWENGAMYIGNYLAHFDSKKVVNSSFTVKEGTLSIAGSTFDYTDAITSVDLGNTVKYIGSNAFYNASTIKTFKNTDALCELGKTVFTNSEYYNTQSNWDNGLLYVGKCLVAAQNNLQSVNIREGTILIAPYTFERNETLTAVTFPQSLVTIGEYAFSKSALTSVSFPASLRTIADYAFMDTVSLTKIEFSEGLETIGYYAFDGCNQAGDVIVPESVKQLDENALCLGSACRIFLKGTLKNINASKYWNGFWNSNFDNRTPFYEFSKDQPSDEGNYWHYDTEGNIQIW